MDDNTVHRKSSETENSLELSDEEAGDSEFEDLQPLGSPTGVLTMHIKNCQGLNISLINKAVQCFIRISVGETIKCTKLHSLTDINQAEASLSLCFDEWRYFSVQISEQNSSVVNPKLNPDCEPDKIMVEFFVFKPEARNPTLMGKDFLNLMEILNQSVVTHQFSLTLNKQVVCELDVEMTLTYGSFGYGYSHLFKHPEKTLEDLVDKSLFLRCSPPDDRRDSHNNVMTPQPGGQINVLSLLTNKHDKRHVMDQIQKRGRLLKLYKAQEECETDEDAVQFLEKVVMKKPTRAPLK